MNQNNPIQLSAIVAMAKNRTIGLNNQLPWHLPADLKHFKNITTGHPILMGRKTYESIGRPLPNRTNIVLTRDSKLKIEDCFVVNSLDAALDIAAKQGQTELFIIGGAEIYQQLLPAVQKLYLTIIEHEFEGDSHFTELDMSKWQETERESHQADENNPYSYSFITLERK